jgi:hypothetical protein
MFVATETDGADSPMWACAGLKKLGLIASGVVGTLLIVFVWARES